MKRICFLLSLTISGYVNGQVLQTPDTALSSKEQSIVLISAFAAEGNMSRLSVELTKGLDSGVSINEAKEILVQLYAYAGFPRSLNALNNLMAVLEERTKKGKKDLPGKSPSAISNETSLLISGTSNQTKLTGARISGGVYDFAPVIDQFLKAHLFGAVFGRDNLDWRTRELVTISALAAMDKVEPQLKSHYSVGLYNGLTKNQLKGVVHLIYSNVSNHKGNISSLILQSVLDDKPYQAIPSSNEKVFAQGEKITTDNFIGAAWLMPLVASDSSNDIQVGNVTFEKKARTKWHLHPGGQILLITGGVGYYQEKGQAKRLLKKGDVINCPANIPHWHGASHDSELIQLAITNSSKGATIWLEEVTDEEYHKEI